MKRFGINSMKLEVVTTIVFIFSLCLKDTCLSLVLFVIIISCILTSRDFYGLFYNI